MKEKLLKVWKACETKQLGKIFKEYMESLGVKKWNARTKRATNTYLVDGKDTEWNRVSCYYNKDSDEYSMDDLSLVLRKRSGNYFIVSRKGVRAFESDHHGVITYDEKLLAEIMLDHKLLFDELFKLV